MAEMATCSTTAASMSVNSINSTLLVPQLFIL
jgi:hypothetical protein